MIIIVIVVTIVLVAVRVALLLYFHLSGRPRAACWGRKVAVSFSPRILENGWLTNIVLSVGSQLAQAYPEQIEILLKLADLFKDTWPLPPVARIIVWDVYLACV